MLNPKTIYRKTQAGVAEIQARALGLRAELRRLLILIDGNSPLERLAAFVRGAEIDFLIAELEAQGLITAATIGQALGAGTSTTGSGATAASAVSGVMSSSPPVSAPAAAASLANMAGDDVGLEPTAAQVLAVRRAAIHMLHNILGPDADAMAVRIERCKDSKEMRATITDIRQILDRQMGPAVGQRFLDAVRGAAEGSR